LIYSLIAAAVLVPAVASAELAVTTRSVNMRAGPDVSFPQVAFLSPNVSVDVVGCVTGYQWCDVIAGPNRGWVAGAYLSSRYNNVPTVISYGGPTIGIPLVSFSIGPYWDSYYQGRPWWNNRTYWYSHYDNNRYAARAPEYRAPQRYVEPQRNYSHDNHQANNRAEYHGNNNNNYNRPGNESHGNNNNNQGHSNNNGGNREYHGPNDQAHPNAQQ
jgi:uncharacterized protein YraI